MASFTDSPEEARGRRNLMVALAFLFLSIVVLYLPSGVQNQISAGLRATVLRPFIATQEALAQARLRAEDARRLQASLDSLAAIVASQAPLVEESRRLHQLLGLRERAPRTFLPASVIRPGTAGSESMFLLDVGSEQGVRVGDPVVMRSGDIGLVGVIQQVRRGVAIALDWSHPEFRASAMTADGEIYGMVRPWRGLFREEDRLLLDGTPYYERLEPETLITTSGLGGVFPRGIPIGTVEEVAEEEGRWRKAYWLRPAVGTGVAHHVLVVLRDTAAEGMMELFQSDPPAGDPGGETGPWEGDSVDPGGASLPGGGSL